MFALLHVLHSVSSCPFSLVTWLHKACLIFVSFSHGFLFVVGDERQIIALVVIKGTNFYVVTYMSLSSLCCNIFSFHDESSLQNFNGFFQQFFLR